MEFIRVIDIHEVAGKQEIQADMGDYSVVLESFEHIDHAKAWLNDLWLAGFNTAGSESFRYQTEVPNASAPPKSG